MKLLKLVLVFSGALLIGGAAGFFVCYLTKAQPLEQANEARRVHADSLAGVLADSIAANEVWLGNEKIAQADTLRLLIADFERKTGKNIDEAMATYGVAPLTGDFKKIKNEEYPYMKNARRHINWMKQEKAWIESLR